MTSKVIYRYFASDGKQGVDTPFIIPGATAIQRLRLIADDGKLLTNGSLTVSVIDVKATDMSNWKEIDKPADFNNIGDKYEQS